MKIPAIMQIGWMQSHKLSHNIINFLGNIVIFKPNVVMFIVYVSLIWNDLIPGLRGTVAAFQYSPRCPMKKVKNYIFHLNSNLTALFQWTKPKLKPSFINNKNILSWTNMVNVIHAMAQMTTDQQIVNPLCNHGPQESQRAPFAFKAPVNKFHDCSVK